MKHKGTVYLYNMSGSRARQIGLLCVRLGLAVRQVAPAMFGMKLGALAGIPGYEHDHAASEEAPFEDEMLLMKDFDNQTLDAFLKGFRSMKIPPVPLKAVLTPTNSGWTSSQLRDAIHEEHEYMTRQKEAAQKGENDNE